jgi:hypothetical protein
MIEGAGSASGLTDTAPGGPKTSGSGSTTLAEVFEKLKIFFFTTEKDVD